MDTLQDLEKLQKFIDKYGVDYRIQGITLLNWASDLGYTDAVQLLLQNNATVDVTDNMGNTALLLAVLYGHEKIVELLIGVGADVNIIDNNGISALMLSTSRISGKNPKIKRMLIEAGSKEKDGGLLRLNKRNPKSSKRKPKSSKSITKRSKNKSKRKLRK